MIRALRVRHRATFVVLAVLVPAALGAALLGRRTPAGPPPRPDPADVSVVTQRSEVVAVWSHLSLITRMWRDEDGSLGLRLEAWRAPAPPTTLLYWSAEEPRQGELPGDARFVGALGTPPREFVLRDAPAGGWLVLFSLGHGEVVGSLDLSEGP